MIYLYELTIVVALLQTLVLWREVDESDKTEDARMFLQKCNQSLLNRINELRKAIKK